MKRILLLGAAALALATSVALAQGVNQVPQVGTISNIIRNPTYSASSIGLVPAASATDIFCLAPSTTRNMSIRKITIGGTAGTAIDTPFILYKRATVDTGGTAATGLAAPVAAGLGTTDPASTATLIAYTANPTITDSSPIVMDIATVPIDVTTTANGQTTLTYGTSQDLFSKGLDLPKNSTKQLCVNLNGVSISSGVLDINAQWQESP